MLGYILRHLSNRAYEVPPLGEVGRGSGTLVIGVTAALKPCIFTSRKSNGWRNANNRIHFTDFTVTDDNYGGISVSRATIEKKSEKRCYCMITKMPLSSQRCYCVTTKMPLSSQRCYCEVTKMPLSPQRCYCEVTKMPLSPQRCFCEVTKMPLSPRRCYCVTTKMPLSSQRCYCVTTKMPLSSRQGFDNLSKIPSTPALDYQGGGVVCLIYI